MFFPLLPSGRSGGCFAPRSAAGGAGSDGKPHPRSDSCRMLSSPRICKEETIRQQISREACFYCGGTIFQEKRRSGPGQDSINQFRVINCKGNRLRCPSAAICQVMSMGREMMELDNGCGADKALIQFRKTTAHRTLSNFPSTNGSTLQSRPKSRISSVHCREN
jgi:hypothetical protein